MNSKPIFSIVFIFLILTLRSQTLEYNMSALGINFGKLYVTKTVLNDSMYQIDLKAKGILKMLWIDRIDETKSSVKFLKGDLIYSSYKHWEKTKLKKWATVQREGKIFNATTTIGEKTFTETPRYTNLNLYFSKPSYKLSVFNESDATFSLIKKIDDDRFELVDSEGVKNTFYYLSTSLVKQEIKLPLATVYITFVKQL